MTAPDRQPLDAPPDATLDPAFGAPSHAASDAAPAPQRERRHRLAAATELSAAVAHELRMPLTGIASAAQLLRYRAQEDPVLERNVGRILREVERLNRVASTLLDYGSPQPPRLAPGDPDAVWDAVLDDHRGLLESRALAVTRTRATPPARCALDAAQLAQALGNVLMHAIDAAPEASDLALASERLPDGAWQCRLRRGGPPLSADALARAFELFAPPGPGGAGVGLALAERRVEAHGGTITLTSDAVHGTVATVTLPAARA